MSVLLTLLLLEGMPLVGARAGDIRTIIESTSAREHASIESSFRADLDAVAPHRRRYRRKRHRARARMTNTSYTALRKVPVGAWGGQHISLEVSEANATFELDCAGGTIDEPLHLDSNNRFDVRGVFIKEHGGPIEAGEQADRRPARFTGWTDGRKMMLTITMTEGGDVVGNFTLEFGKAPRITKCL